MLLEFFFFSYSVFLDSISIEIVLFFRFISNSVLSNSAFAYFCYVIKTKKNFQNSLKKNNTLYTCKQPLMMANEVFESARDNFGKFIHQFQPETKTLIRKLERILIKLYWQNVSLLFNQTCLNEWLQPNYTHTHTHTHTHIYVCI